MAANDRYVDGVPAAPMANPAKARGDRAEREAAELLTLLLGLPIRRRLGAGRLDDEGDLEGLEGFALQVADWSDVTRAVREKPAGAERQRRNGRLAHAGTLVRFRGGTWRVVLTPEHWARLVLALRAGMASLASQPFGPLPCAEQAGGVAPECSLVTSR